MLTSYFYVKVLNVFSCKIAILLNLKAKEFSAHLDAFIKKKIIIIFTNVTSYLHI